MDYLKRSEYEEIGDTLQAGEQVNIDHDDCPAGLDTKKRLYIKRTDDGNRVIAYCHHCQCAGSYGAIAYRNGKTTGKNSNAGSSSSATSGRLPADYTIIGKEWSSAGRSWVYKSGITDKEIVKYSIGYSDQHKRIVLPIYIKNKLQGYQLRRLLDHDKKPKYLTYVNVKPLFWVSDEVLLSSSLVITEDILSGIKCARFCTSVALLTVSASNELIERLAKSRYNKFIIFLDNDNRQVKKAQIILKNRLSLLGEVVVIHANRDPKEHSNDELRRLLT